jgi:hypothetical protein
MNFNLTKIIDAIDTAANAYQAATRLAGDLAALLEPTDQDELKERLARLRAENDAGHARLQQKLAEIVRGAE